MNDFIIVLCTVASADDAGKIAEKLVGGKSAACVNIVSGIKSVYSWKGEICRDDELLLIIKSRADLFEKIKKDILSVHPYEVPEIISFPIAGGHDNYLKWIDEVTVK